SIVDEVGNSDVIAGLFQRAKDRALTAGRLQKSRYSVKPLQRQQRAHRLDRGFVEVVTALFFGRAFRADVGTQAGTARLKSCFQSCGNGALDDAGSLTLSIAQAASFVNLLAGETSVRRRNNVPVWNVFRAPS